MGVGRGRANKKKNTLFFALLQERVPPILPNARAPSPRPPRCTRPPRTPGRGPDPFFRRSRLSRALPLRVFFSSTRPRPPRRGDRERQSTVPRLGQRRAERAGPCRSAPPRFRVRNGAARLGRLDRAPAQVRAPGGGRAEDAVRAGALCSGEGREERGEALGARPIRRRPPCRQHSPPPGLPFPSPLRPPPPPRSRRSWWRSPTCSPSTRR